MLTLALLLPLLSPSTSQIILGGASPPGSGPPGSQNAAVSGILGVGARINTGGEAFGGRSGHSSTSGSTQLVGLHTAGEKFIATLSNGERIDFSQVRVYLVDFFDNGKLLSFSAFQWISQVPRPLAERILTGRHVDGVSQKTMNSIITQYNDFLSMLQTKAASKGQNNRRAEPQLRVLSPSEAKQQSFASTTPTSISSSAWRCVGLPAYLYVESAQPTAAAAAVYAGVTERACLDVCTANRDGSGITVPCIAATYADDSATCAILSGKATPDGDFPFERALNVRYYEKICLRPTVPVTCFEAMFRRVDQKVLAGFAKNFTIQKSLADCVDYCVFKQSDCKSAVYYEDYNECITNDERAENVDSEVFLTETKDKVVYFDNGCFIPDLAEENLVAPKRDRLAILNEGKARQNKPILINAGERVVDTQIGKGSIVDETETIDTAPTDPLTILTPSSNGQRTWEAEPNTDGYTEWSQWTYCHEPEGRRVRRRKCTLPLCLEATVQTQWCSDLDPSEIVRPSAIARAKSRARAAQTAAAVSTIESSRRGATQIREGRRTPNAVAVIDKAPEPDTPSPDQIVNTPVEGWGSWTPQCAPFADDQKCQDGNLIGFQTRSCVGSPFECQGPFFRYCMIPC